MLTKSQRIKYNSKVRSLAFQASVNTSQTFGINTPESRSCQAMWCRRIREEYPLSEYQTHWGNP